MGVTHALMGGLIGASSAVLAPELFLSAVATAYIGGLFPDLDLVFNHRKTLHFPVIYSTISAVLILFSILAGRQSAVLASYFVFSAAVHSWIDTLGGGLEERPWEGTTDKGVYSHTLGRWLPPLQIVRYDGAPEDFLLTLVFALSLFLALEGFTSAQHIVIGSVIVGAVYSAVRKKLLDFRDSLLKVINRLID